MGVFGDLFSGSKAKEPYYQAAAGRAAGLEQATGTLNTGYGDASKYLDTASARFDPLAKTAGQGYDAYAQLYGIGGGDPTAAVRAQPGYQFSQDEGREQVMRASLGTGATGLQSGNTLQSIFDRGRDIGDTKWQQYAEGLKPFLALAPQIAGAQGGYNVGQAGIETDLAKTLSGYQTGTANANSQSIIDAQNASNAASKNVFDAVMGGVKLAASAATGMPMGGGGGGSGFDLSRFLNGGNPSSAAYGTNPFTPYGTVNPAYG